MPHVDEVRDLYFYDTFVSDDEYAKLIEDAYERDLIDETLAELANADLL